MIRTLIVAAYASVRAGLHALLSGAEDITVVGDATGSADLERLLPAARADVAVLDDSPDDRPAVLDLLADAGVGLVLLAERGDEYGTLARAGLPGWAYLLKDADGTQIAGAVRAASSGLAALEPGLLVPQAAPLLARRDDADEGGEALSAREREVLQLMAQGLPNKVIAARLGISLHTVKFHVAAILAALGVGSRTEAVTLGARRGLVIL